MINYRPSTEHDLSFIDELLQLAKTNPAFALGYPNGSLKEVEQNLADIDQTITDRFFIAERDGSAIGIVGIFDASWGLYLFGPVFIHDQHNEESIKALLSAFLSQSSLINKTMNVDVRASNEALSTALEALSFVHTYSGVSMYYDMKKHIPCDDQPNIIKVSRENKAYLSRINEIFTAYLEPWADKSEADLIESLEGGATIAAILDNAKIAGAIVWEWHTDYGELEYICVDKEYQGKGYGRMLLDDAANSISNMMTDEGESLLYLDVSRKNTSAQKFYKDYGFELEYFRKVYQRKSEM